MAKAYSYLRFSSAAQAEGDSLRRQLAAAMAWAAANPDVELDTSLRDLGVSAFKGEHRVRGALSAFLKRVQSGDIPKGSYFLIESFDRLSRENETVAINLLTGITLAGIKVVTLTDGQTYDEKSDAMDLMRAIIVMSRAHEENKARGKKLAAAWADKKRRARETGEILTSRGPAWLRFDREAKRFEVIPERGAVLKRIFNDAADGLGASAIASRLNAEGVAPFGKSMGWHADYVLQTLHTRAVIGTYQPTNWTKRGGERAVRTPDGEAIRDYYPRVIEDDLFNRVQAKVHSRRKGGGRRGETFANILVGIGRCEVCGGAMGIGNRNNSAQVRFMRCYGAVRKHGCDNRKRYLTEPIERDLLAFLAEARLNDAGENPDVALLVAKEHEVEELKRTIGKLLDALEREVPFTEDRLRQRQLELVALEADVKALRARVAATARKPVADLQQAAVALGEELKTATGADLYRLRAKMNATLREIFSFVVPTEGGFYAVAGNMGYLFQPDEILVAKARTDAPMTVQALKAMWVSGADKGTMPASILQQRRN